MNFRFPHLMCHVSWWPEKAHQILHLPSQLGLFQLDPVGKFLRFGIEAELSDDT
jgi:hypothetical protein